MPLPLSRGGYGAIDIFSFFQVAKRFIRSFPNRSNLWQLKVVITPRLRTSSVWTSAEHGLAMDCIAPPASLEPTLRAAGAAAAGTACTSYYVALSLFCFLKYQNNIIIFTDFEISSTRTYRQQYHIGLPLSAFVVFARFVCISVGVLVLRACSVSPITSPLCPIRLLLLYYCDIRTMRPPSVPSRSCCGHSGLGRTTAVLLHVTFFHML